MDERIKSIAENYGFLGLEEKLIKTMAELTNQIKSQNLGYGSPAANVCRFVEMLVDVDIAVEQMKHKLFKDGDYHLLFIQTKDKKLNEACRLTQTRESIRRKGEEQ